MLTVLYILILFLLIGGMLYYVYRKEDEPRNVAVFSGSFNPLHVGHKAIIETLSREFDWVYLIVTPKNPLKDGISSDTVDRRMSDARSALYKHELYNVTLSSIEKEMNPPYYTIRTLDELKRREPNNRFSLVIGADNLRNIREWNSYQRILREYGVIVFPRGDFGVEELENLKNELLKEDKEYKIQINETMVPNISSTEIRDAMKHGVDISKMLM